MFDYFYGQQADQFSFYRVPKVLFTEDCFWNVSTDAKLLYGILLDRMNLSARNDWLDKEGRVYIIFTIDEIKSSLGCAEKKTVKLLDELEKKCGLIERKRQGLGKPNLIYVKNFISGSVERQFLNCQKDNSGVVENTIQELSKAQGNNTDNKYTEFNDTDPFLSSDFYGKDNEGTGEFARYYECFYDQLDMEYLKQDFRHDDEILELILRLIVETMCSNRKQIRIASDDISSKSLHKSRGGSAKAPAQKQFQILIDVQAKMAEGKTVGYEKWAKKFNRKEAARTVILLKEKGLGNYDDLVAHIEKLSARFDELSDSIKAAEKRIVEVQALLTHMDNYYDTRAVYVEYRKAGYSKKFFEEHRQEITLHKAAKQAFDELNLTKLPSRKSLYEEFYQLTAQKKKEYTEYRQVRKEKEELLIAKQTVEIILNIDKKKEQEKEKKSVR